MGVPFRIVLYACDEGTANKAVTQAFARIHALNQLCSDYDPASDLRVLCRDYAPGIPHPVNPELASLLQTSVSMTHRTKGCFDVTVGPLVKLWRRARRQKKLPDPERLRDAMERCGGNRLHVTTNRVRLDQEGMQLDLGGIAKGYATDQALEVLRRAGIPRALIDGSGDIRVGDPPPRQQGWRIRIAGFDEFQSQNGEEPGEVPAPNQLLLANAAVATSGDLYQFVELDGVRYSHILDPRSGNPCIRRSLVTVVAASGTEADALASALNVADAEYGFQMLKQNFPLSSARIVFVGKQGIRTMASPHFPVVTRTMP